MYTIIKEVSINSQMKNAKNKSSTGKRKSHCQTKPTINLIPSAIPAGKGITGKNETTIGNKTTKIKTLTDILTRGLSKIPKTMFIMIQKLLSFE